MTFQSHSHRIEEAEAARRRTGAEPSEDLDFWVDFWFLKDCQICWDFGIFWDIFGFWTCLYNSLQSFARFFADFIRFQTRIKIKWLCSWCSKIQGRVPGAGETDWEANTTAAQVWQLSNATVLTCVVIQKCFAEPDFDWETWIVQTWTMRYVFMQFGIAKEEHDACIVGYNCKQLLFVMLYICRSQAWQPRPLDPPMLDMANVCGLESWILTQGLVIGGIGRYRRNV